MKNTPDITPRPETEKLIKRSLRLRWLTAGVAHAVVLVLSLALILFISYDTFAKIPLLEDRTYMWFQFIVCLIFLSDFFLQLSLREDKRHYVATKWFFLIISVPYLNIIDIFNINFSSSVMYYLSFVPLVRGAYSLAMVVGYVSTNRSTSLVASYAVILMSIVYFASLIFYREEGNINSDVTSYWDALWWACMNVTTIGCYISPMSAAGMVCGALLAGSGMLMLPLFTVMVTDSVKRHNEKAKEMEAKLYASINRKYSQNSDSDTTATQTIEKDLKK